MKRNVLLPVLLGFFFAALLPGLLKAQTISTIAGVGLGDDSLATHAELVGPVVIARDVAGNYYIGEQSSYRVRKIDPSGIITTFAGNGQPGSSGDGGPATAASLGVIYGIAVDKFGNVFIVDNVNNCIRKVNTSGIITTIAGNSLAAGYTGDGGPATAAKLNAPSDIVTDTAGNVIFADWLNNVVRKINTAGIISTIVGDGTVAGLGDGGPATASSLGRPFRLAIDRQGNLYIAAVWFQCITKVDTGGIIHIIADTTGTYHVGGPDGDGGPAIHCTMTSPCGLAVDTFGNLFFSDISNHRVRKIDAATGIISNYAANGTPGFGGDGGPATAAMMGILEGVACDPAGNLLICDPDNNRVRIVNTSGVISTFAGQSALFGEGIPAVNAELCGPSNVACDAAGNVYVADYWNNRVRKIDVVTGLITTAAGSGIAGYDDGYNGDNIPATTANIFNPAAMAFDLAGNMYIADYGNSRIRKVDAAGIITTVAGKDTAGYKGDHGPATAAWLQGPTGVAVDFSGNIYIADQGNSRIRMVNSAGIITTVAGSGVAGYIGDGMPATASRLKYPVDVACDGLGNIYIADLANSRIRKVDTNGKISTIAGVSTYGYSGDGGPATAAKLNGPSGVKADGYGNVFIADFGNDRVRWVNAAGMITTVAGNGISGFSGDGGPATAARISGPGGVAVDGSANLYIDDGRNHRIRKLTMPYSSVRQTTSPILDLQVYPNPAHDNLIITYITGMQQQLQLALFDMTGRQVLTTTMISERKVVGISNLPVGVYTLQVRSDDGTVKNVKVVKE